MTPLCIDLFCGLGGWAEGFLAEGYDVIGFDIERHDYGTGGYPGQLVLQDVLTLDGRQFRNAAVIVASPPCQAYSYRAMPWKRAKALPPPSNELFDACFRIAREANEERMCWTTCRPCDGTGMTRGCCRCEICDGKGVTRDPTSSYIPLVVENVKGAQPWVGRAKWHYGSYYLWGDVPALMPSAQAMKANPDGTNHGVGSWFAIADSKNRGASFHAHEKGIAGGSFQSAAVKNNGGSWFNIGSPGQTETNRNPVNGTKGFTTDLGRGHDWRQDPCGRFNSKSNARKAASAQIAKIPFPLAQHIARVYKP